MLATKQSECTHDTPVGLSKRTCNGVRACVPSLAHSNCCSHKAGRKNSKACDNVTKRNRLRPEVAQDHLEKSENNHQAQKCNEQGYLYSV